MSAHFVSHSLLLTWTLAILLHFAACACPSSKELRPCTCGQHDMMGSAYVTCTNVDNDQDLVNAMSSLRGKKDIYSVTIADSFFNYVPAETFKGTELVELEIQGTSLRSLSDTDSAFIGLEDHLQILLLTDCTLMSEWDWQLLHNLRRLQRLEIVRADLQDINEGLKELTAASSILHISVVGNLINWMHDEAFSNFPNLLTLYLSNNRISEVKRSMFPSPASELSDIDLSYNLIEELPEDIFTNMPKLELIGLTGNKLLLLSEKVFKPIWSQLKFFNAMSNELRCDCRMSWILEVSMPEDLRAICAKPPTLKGKNLNSLQSKDLWCYYVPSFDEKEVFSEFV